MVDASIPPRKKERINPFVEESEDYQEVFFDKKQKSINSEIVSRKREKALPGKSSSARREKQIADSTDDEVTLKFHPRKMVKWSVVILLFVMVFFLGQWSAGFSLGSEIAEPSGEEQAGIFKTVGSAVGNAVSIFSSLGEKLTAEKETPPNPEPTVNESVASEDAALEASVGNETTEEAMNESSAASEDSQDEEKKEEKVITSYSKVALALDEVYKQWKGTWGKMTGITYTIKNNEDGTIKPAYFIMLVEGYDDIEKNFPVSYKSQKVTSMSTHTGETGISGGFSYNDHTAGELTDVEITLSLYDSSDKLIATVKRAVDLSGE